MLSKLLSRVVSTMAGGGCCQVVRNVNSSAGSTTHSGSISEYDGFVLLRCDMTIITAAISLEGGHALCRKGRPC